MSNLCSRRTCQCDAGPANLSGFCCEGCRSGAQLCATRIHVSGPAIDPNAGNATSQKPDDSNPYSNPYANPYAAPAASTPAPVAQVVINNSNSHPAPFGDRNRALLPDIDNQPAAAVAAPGPQQPAPAQPNNNSNPYANPYAAAGAGNSPPQQQQQQQPQPTPAAVATNASPNTAGNPYANPYAAPAANNNNASNQHHQPQASNSSDGFSNPYSSPASPSHSTGVVIDNAPAPPVSMAVPAASGGRQQQQQPPSPVAVSGGNTPQQQQSPPQHAPLQHPYQQQAQQQQAGQQQANAYDNFMHNYGQQPHQQQQPQPQSPQSPGSQQNVAGQNQHHQHHHQQQQQPQNYGYGQQQQQQPPSPTHSEQSTGGVMGICLFCGDISEQDPQKQLCKNCIPRVTVCSYCNAAYAENGPHPLCAACKTTVNQQMCTKCNSSYAVAGSSLCQFCLSASAAMTHQQQQQYNQQQQFNQQQNFQPQQSPNQQQFGGGYGQQQQQVGAGDYAHNYQGYSPQHIPTNRPPLAPEDVCKKCHAAEATTNAGYCDWCAKQIEQQAHGASPLMQQPGPQPQQQQAPGQQQPPQIQPYPRYPCLRNQCPCLADGAFQGYCSAACLRGEHGPCKYLQHYPGVPRGTPCVNSNRGCPCDSYDGKPTSPCGRACGGGKPCASRVHTVVPEPLASQLKGQARSDQAENDRIRQQCLPYGTVPPLFTPPQLPQQQQQQQAQTQQAQAQQTAAPAGPRAPACATPGCPCDALPGYQNCGKWCRDHGPCRSRTHVVAPGQQQQAGATPAATQQQQQRGTPCANASKGCPCDSFDGQPGSFCSKYCRNTKPCTARSHVHLNTTPAAATSTSTPTRYGPRCAGTNCPCDAIPGYSHCCKNCAGGTPCTKAWHVNTTPPGAGAGPGASPSSNRGGYLTATRLHVSDADFKRMNSKFVSTWNSSGDPCPEVIAVFALRTTAALEARFEAKKADLVRKSGTHGCTELLHGTKMDAHCTLWDRAQLCSGPCGVCGITRTGFDASRIGLGALSQKYKGVSGSTKGFLRYGYGAYFGFNSNKVLPYAAGGSVTLPGGGKRCCVMVFEVALGKPKKLAQDDENLVAPPAGFDSVVGLTKAEGGTTLNWPEATIYDVSQCIPRYAIFVKGNWK